MADLSSIIRLRKFQLDEKRQALAELQRFSDSIAADIERLDQAVEAEKQVALVATDPAAVFAFGGFIQGARERRLKLEDSLRKLEAQIEIAVEQLRVAFADLKKYEQTEAQRRAREVRKRTRAENAQLDEIGLDGYRRRASESPSA